MENLDPQLMQICLSISAKAMRKEAPSPGSRISASSSAPIETNCILGIFLLIFVKGNEWEITHEINIPLK